MSITLPPAARNRALILLLEATGDWWKDERRDRCAYCGSRMKRSAGHTRSPNGATRDHLIPKAHRGRYVTVPCCRKCNQQKGALSLPEFLSSAYFQGLRKAGARDGWSTRDLWLAFAIAAIRHSQEPDTGHNRPGNG